MALPSDRRAYLLALALGALFGAILGVAVAAAIFFSGGMSAVHLAANSFYWLVASFTVVCAGVGWLHVWARRSILESK